LHSLVPSDYLCLGPQLLPSHAKLLDAPMHEGLIVIPIASPKTLLEAPHKPGKQSCTKCLLCGGYKSCPLASDPATVIIAKFSA
jgi:hypothetical protein